MPMYRLVPDFIQRQYQRGQTAGSFDAAVLFVDITGFTPIIDSLMGRGQHGAEVMANIIGQLFEPLIGRVFEQGGFVSKLAGDAFTALFPSGADRTTCRHWIHRCTSCWTAKLRCRRG